MVCGKRLTVEEIGCIKCLREERYSNRETIRRIHGSAKIVNNVVQDAENYGKKYRGDCYNSEGKKKYFT